MFDSALNTPFQTFSGNELYPDLISKAARLAFGLITDHPFIDGNKRIGTHAMLIFLRLNNVEFEYDDDDLIALILGIAAGENDDKTIFEWLKKHRG